MLLRCEKFQTGVINAQLRTDGEYPVNQAGQTASALVGGVSFLASQSYARRLIKKLWLLYQLMRAHKTNASRCSCCCSGVIVI
jgi:hypothetical protein